MSKLKIRSLNTNDFDDLIQCLLEAFEGYFVAMPTDKNYWRERFRAARIDWSLSFAAFDQSKMIGFIITGVDHHLGLKTAFNSGTGILKNTEVNILLIGYMNMPSLNFWIPESKNVYLK